MAYWSKKTDIRIKVIIAILCFFSIVLTVIVNVSCYLIIEPELNKDPNYLAAVLEAENTEPKYPFQLQEKIDSYNLEPGNMNQIANIAAEGNNNTNAEDIENLEPTEIAEQLGWTRERISQAFNAVAQEDAVVCQLGNSGVSLKVLAGEHYADAAGLEVLNEDGNGDDDGNFVYACSSSPRSNIVCVEGPSEPDMDMEEIAQLVLPEMQSVFSDESVDVTLSSVSFGAEAHPTIEIKSRYAENGAEMVVLDSSDKASARVAVLTFIYATQEERVNLMAHIYLEAKI